MRQNGRMSVQARPLRIVPNYTSYCDGSVLIEMGETRVLCTVTVEDNVPNWLRASRHSQGWLTAEYSMLPSSTHTRSKRERSYLGGRTQEIQRFIGRSLRGVMDLSKIPDKTFIVDCDVLQADGGTRTASINGSFVALKMAVDKLLRQNRLRHNPLKESVAAISVGLVSDEILVDLDYSEDSQVDLDMNIVMTQSCKLLEIQGTAEKAPFEKHQITQIVDAAQDALVPIFDLQNAASEGQEVEG